MRISSSALSLALFGLLVFIGVLSSGAPWVTAHAILFSGAGLLMLLFPPQVALPRSWWILGGLFLVFSLAVFLPAGWFGIPAWRSGLEGLGVNTGGQVAIQAREAAEGLGAFAIVLLTGLWLAGQRLEMPQAAKAALAVNLAVALYVLLALSLRDSLAADYGTDLQTRADHFGFFPNRNHNATFLALGILTGFGCITQAVRDRRWISLGFSAPATALCLIAILGWSVSRAGVMLVSLGAFAWLLVLGRRYLGRHGVKALALGALLVVGLFALTENRMKDRLQQTVAKLDPTAADADAATETPVDFRLPTWRDTAGMVRAFPLTGVGAGQFRYIFPQYRDQTAISTYSDNVHPESDWLWIASEGGVPAALAIGALVVTAAVYSLRHARSGRGRALRGACLVAALIIPLHGLFDVPGHRTALAWSAALLYALSLPAPDDLRRPPPAPRFPWLFRSAGALVLGVGLWLAWAAWLGGPPPRLSLADTVRRQALDLSKEDDLRRAEAAKRGDASYAPAPGSDPLEQAFQLLGQTLPLVPMDRRLYQLRGTIGLSFDDKEKEVDQAFAIERALDPTWPDAALRQGSSWAFYDPARAGRLWQEALESAGRLDARYPVKRPRREVILERIRRAAHGKPQLEAIVAGLSP